MAAVSLPVYAAAPAVAPADLVRMFHRAQLQRARAVAEETVLDGGTWLRNPDLQPLPEANAILDAVVPPDHSPEAWIAEVEHLSAGCPVHGWTLNPSLSTESLAAALVARGWQPRVQEILHLPHLAEPTVPAMADLTVIPARAGYGPLQRLMDDRHAGDRRAELAVLALDDAHLDGWLALRRGTPVAAVFLLNDGQAGTVTDLYVAPAHRGVGIGRAMLLRALDGSARADHRHVLAAAPPGGTALFARLGFQPVGRWVRYER